MAWDSIIGQQRVKRQLMSSLKQSRVSHAYLFVGHAGVGKDAVAIEFSKALNCERQSNEACDRCSSCLKFVALQHPNLHLIFALPVGKGEESGDQPLAKLSGDDIEIIQQQLRLKSQNPYHVIVIPKATTIKVNSIREIRRMSSLSSVGSGRKVFIVLNADMMNDEASNALLKTLEEPSTDTVLILTTAYQTALLPTIVSRCQIIRFDNLSENEIRDALVNRDGIEKSRVDVIAHLANGSFTRALELMETNIADGRKKSVDFLRSTLFGSRDELLAMIDNLAAELSRIEIENLLQALQLWLRDTMLMSEHIDRVVNIDDADALKNFTARYKNVDYASLQTEIDKAISLINKNVYIPLILIHLAIQLKKYISAISMSHQRIAG